MTTAQNDTFPGRWRKTRVVFWGSIELLLATGLFWTTTAISSSWIFGLVSFVLLLSLLFLWRRADAYRSDYLFAFTRRRLRPRGHYSLALRDPLLGRHTETR